MDTLSHAASYPPPVNQLLSLGEASRGGPDAWPDYPALHGLGLEQVPELARMATDERLLWAEGDDPIVWAPVHAWRALGQLQAESAIEPLAALLSQADDDDNEWALEELPVVFGRIGRAALPALVRLMGNQDCGVFSQVAAARGLEQIAAFHPDLHSECVAGLTHRLGWHIRNDPTLNGFLISYLLNLQAVEAASMMEHAFAAEDVDLSVAGDWEDVQVALGMIPARHTPRPSLGWVRDLDVPASLPAAADSVKRSAAQKKAAKSKRKSAARSRKRNRRHK